jgi:hypothetical protein
MSALDTRQDNGRSSLFEKLPAELRREIDIAIVERTPPTYAAIWMDLKLAEHRISYSAFYRYARRLRDRANLAEVAELTGDEVDLDTPIRRLLARRALDSLISDDQSSPAELTALLSALRHSTRTVQQNRKAEDDSRLAWARLEHDREFLQLKLEHLQTMRRRFLAHQGDETPEVPPAPHLATA